MHIQDGVLSLPVAGFLAVIVILAWLPALKKFNLVMEDRHIPLISILSVLIFALQIPYILIFDGVSSHLIGAAIAAIILGPYGALISITLALIVQAMFFAHGGIISLGANIFNMGIIAGFGALAVNNYLKYLVKNQIITTFAAAWASVVLTAVAVSIELALSGTAEISTLFFATVPFYLVLGIAEGLLAVIIFYFLNKARPDLLKMKQI